jgi:hypothetical protein
LSEFTGMEFTLNSMKMFIEYRALPLGYFEELYSVINDEREAARLALDAVDIATADNLLEFGTNVSGFSHPIGGKLEIHDADRVAAVQAASEQQEIEDTAAEVALAAEKRTFKPLPQFKPRAVELQSLSYDNGVRGEDRRPLRQLARPQVRPVQPARPQQVRPAQSPRKFWVSGIDGTVRQAEAREVQALVNQHHPHLVVMSHDQTGGWRKPDAFGFRMPRPPAPVLAAPVARRVVVA